MKTMFTIPPKFKPSFKGWVFIIVALFLSPFINCALGINWGTLFTFGISDQKDFFTVWIALFGAIGIAFNIYQNQKRTVNQDRQLENQNRQLQNQEEQLKEQEKQIELQSKSQRDSRFSKGIELLGNDNESARTGAAYSLCFLAKDFPDEFSKPVFDILCSHIRTLTTSDDYLEKHPTVSNEVQTILNLLFKTTDGSNITPFSTYKANLSRAHLEGADLEKAHLEKAYLFDVNLESAILHDANLEKAHLFRAHLENAFLEKAHLEKAFLQEAVLEEAVLEGAFIYSSQKTVLKQSGADLSGVEWVNNEDQTIITDKDSQ